MKNKILNIISALAVVITAITIFTFKGDRKMNTGIELINMDLSIRPGDDFYDFATSGWRFENPIPDDYARFGAFEKLIQDNDAKIKSLVVGIAQRRHATGTIEQKIGTFYNVAMDDKKLNNDGIEPARSDLAEINSLANRSDLAAFLGGFHKTASGFWSSGIAPDMKDSSIYIFVIGQSGIGLPEREYYFDKESAEIRKKYKNYLSDLFMHFDIDGDVQGVYKLEERLARAHSKKENLRDPEKNYHRFSYAEFKKKFNGFNWDAYFDARGARPMTINVGQPKALTEALEIIDNAPMDDIKLYLKRMLIGKASAFLDDAAFDLTFDFYSRTLSGQPSPKPRWRRALSILDASIGEAVGEVYVKKYFPPEAKERMEQLVENLRDAYFERIKKLEWMSDPTKKKALDKLATFRAKIGYPDKFRDYSKLEITDDSYWANIKRADMFEDEYWLEKLGKAVDRDLWLMNPHTVNAYYWSQTNEICFPAGILQPPFFDMSADDAFNYGAIGSVIAHEMTHGFDDSGRKFDKDGNMNDWWTRSDAQAFEKRAKIMREFFNGIEVAPGIFANGEFSLGENLSDYGGVTISFTAFQNAAMNTQSLTWKNFTPEQRFFISYASIWAGNIRPEEILRRTKTGVHSLARWRVNGILPHVDAWYKAFDIKPNDILYIAPESRVNIW
ncbi:MAG: M13 family metallopeptidase [Alphaproteobacteria bacterium]|nr:M13 family metallopeptidase [Alphaproteobacteria bacterium]